MLLWISWLGERACWWTCLVPALHEILLRSECGVDSIRRPETAHQQPHDTPHGTGYGSLQHTIHPDWLRSVLQIYHVMALYSGIGIAYTSLLRIFL